ncbi:MAG: hypothetical protein COW30_07215 [Rhodospirillales bacterium CG15_BIG_FIL_POST_REV_8_21_14_020_66_15]|nr:MAG: hypothetical protein COW30_07215 [Rhodospirillales bacterium CG15_BIG_FIL_POST_REV_8_21_14_020_66_15]
MPFFVSRPVRPIFAAALALLLVSAPLSPVRAQANPSDPEMLLEEGTKKILRAFELFIKTIPQYEMPEVLPNGDIIIRRKHPPPGKEDEAPPAPPGDGTKT